MHKQTDIERIIAKSVSQELTLKEQRRLSGWLSQSPDNELMYRLLKEEYEVGEQQQMDSIDEERGWDLLTQKMNKGVLVTTPVPSAKNRLYRFTVAASFILLAGMGFLAWKYWSIISHKNRVVAAQPQQFDPITPGVTKAMLTLADGSVIRLDDAANGNIAMQGYTNITKAEGVLSYQNTYEKQSVPVYNTLATPVGGQYRLVLPDGSKVWLNAQSSLRFPAAFYGHERKVELTGEAYFEIAHSSANPFTVAVRRVEGDIFNVQVLGTHFNISAYASESVAAATLLQGSVRITSGGDASMLKPGQQAQVAGKGKLSIAAADTAKAVAWKNGDFQFDSDNIQTIMNQLARWYDIQVKYEGQKPNDQYTGTISRSNNLQDVLKMLEQSGLKFHITGRTVIISQ